VSFFQNWYRYVPEPPPAVAVKETCGRLGVVTTPGTPTVAFTATAGGGSGGYLYQFWLKDTSGLYTLVQPYSASNVYNWDTTLAPVGTYYVAVQAKCTGSITPNGFDVEDVVSYGLP